MHVLHSQAVFKEMQTSTFGGWNPSMSGLVGSPLLIRRFRCSFGTDPKCIVEVEHHSAAYRLNPKAVGLTDFSDHRVEPETIKVSTSSQEEKTVVSSRSREESSTATSSGIY